MADLPISSSPTDQQAVTVAQEVDSVRLEDVTPAVAAAFANDPCLIWSGEHGLYWRDNAAGYTGQKADAGRYTIGTAFAKTRHCDPSKRIEFHRLSVSSASAEGFVLVPREPTEAMRLAGAGAWLGREVDFVPEWGVSLNALWFAMLNASTPPATDVSEPAIGEGAKVEVDQAPDEDWLTDVIDDSLDMDWTGRVGARAIIAAWEKRHD